MEPAGAQKPEEGKVRGFENPPNQTLYIRNLNDKVKMDEIRKGLYELFSPYGSILGIYAKKTYKMKGQAFVVFKDLQSASEAMRCLQKTPFFGKEMNIHYAKDKSDYIARMEGIYDPSVVEKRKERREAELAKIKETGGKRRAEPGFERAPLTSGIPASTAAAGPVTNNILFVEKLTPEVTYELLTSHFGKYQGFREVRLIPGKGVAFVEYETDVQAGVALVGLNGIQITDNCTLQISYAKK